MLSLFRSICRKRLRRQWQPTPVLLPGNSHEWRSLVGCSPGGRQESDTTELLHFHFSLSCVGEENGNPLQYSCLENHGDGGAWWAAISGIAQSRTRLKWLNSSSSSRKRRCFLIWGFPDSSVGKESACNAGDPGSIPGSGRSAGEAIGYPLQYSWASLVAQLVKNPPAMRETWVLSLGWEDPLEKGKATHSSILAWRIPWTVWSMGLKNVGATFTFTVNLQCCVSCKYTAVIHLYIYIYYFSDYFSL